jgi:hypothetical protein
MSEIHGPDGEVLYVFGQHSDEIECGYCGAQVGKPCVTAKGGEATTPHAERAKRSAAIDSDNAGNLRHKFEAPVREAQVRRVSRLKATYGPRWRYAAEDASLARGDSALGTMMRRWPDGPPDDQSPGDWYCHQPDDGPMERCMFLGPKYDLYHGPVLAVVTDTGSRFRWEVAHNGPHGPYDEHEVVWDAGYCDLLSEAKATAESEAWDMLDGFPDSKAEAIRDGAERPMEDEP